MSRDIFQEFPYFIQEYVYRKGWLDLRDIQKDAFRVLFETDDNLLISSGTASGKTEAALFPILTDIYRNPSKSVSVLYISPLKALINDQRSRLETVLGEADIPLHSWHGDISHSKKKKLLDKPCGILQITPESLESLFINYANEIEALFCDLKYIIIDEVHAFMGQARGLHLMCSIHRIERIAGVSPRRVGLSATLGDETLALEWLSMGVQRPAAVITDQKNKQRIRLVVEHFCAEDIDEFYSFLYEATYQCNCIIFANTRGDTETMVSKLREIAQERGTRNVYNVHHGSINSLLRHEAEKKLKDDSIKAVIAATLTLELGIDIGNLEKVFQVGAPYSCSSFIQRLGRSGRVSGISEMWFMSIEGQPDAIVPNNIPWDLLRNIAIIQLYVEERWIEPIKKIQYPYSLLYQQTMSCLVTQNGLSAAELAQNILTMPVFQSITLEDYRIFLQYLLQLNHIEKTEEGFLIVGLSAEPIVTNYQFYSIIPNEKEYKVIYNGKELGTVNFLPQVNATIMMGGYIWKVNEINSFTQDIYVAVAEGNSRKLWEGKGGDIHDKVFQRMKQVLMEDTNYPYLQENGMQRLKEIRSYVRECGLLSSNYFEAGADKYYYIAWLGSERTRTLEHIMNIDWVKGKLSIVDVKYVNKYSFEIQSQYSGRDFEYDLAKAVLDVTNEELVIRLSRNELCRDKFDEYVPTVLLQRSYANDYLNLESLKEWAKNLVKTKEGEKELCKKEKMGNCWESS